MTFQFPESVIKSEVFFVTFRYNCGSQSRSPSHSHIALCEDAANHIGRVLRMGPDDMVICDTAGRLHNKKNLMDELSKISRVVHKACGTASVETLLVLDAITGQNAISQASQFIDAAGATGIVLTKLDGTAKGGAVISIKAKLGLPVRFVGVGEGMDDLMEFDPDAFVDALFLREE